MAVVLRRWDDAPGSNPVLSGTAGALIAVLDEVLVGSAGWSKVFFGTNKAVYRAPAGNRFYLRVDDTGTTSARVVAYESMTDVDTGTNAFPTAAQVSGGLYATKSDGANTNARAWVIAASDRLFHMWINVAWDNTTNVTTSAYMWSFGDFKPVGTDAYASHLIASVSAAASGNTMHSTSIITSTLGGHYAARPYTGVAGAAQIGKMGDQLTSGASLGGFGYTYPNPADGGVYLAPIRLHDANVLRGTIPGLHHVAHNQSNFGPLDTFQGSGAYAGRTFMCMHQYTASMVALETSNTWDV